MTDYAIIYNIATGAQLGNYSGPDGTISAQQLPDGAAIIAVPMEAWTTPVNLDLVKAYICDQIEAGADAAAAAIIVLSPRKVQTAIVTKEECDAWTTGGDPTKFPFLNALATANGTTIDDEKARFDAAWNAVVAPGALINATSIAAQRRVSEATNLSAIVAAAQIDWTAVLATLAA